MKRVLYLLGIAFLVLPGLQVQAQDSPRVSDELIAQYAALFQSEMAYYGIPGAAVAIIQDGEVVYTNGFGVRNLERGDPFTTDTLSFIGSTTKSMTSMLAAQLVDEGVLTWDTPVAAIYPDFQTSDPELTSRLTFRDLLGMATGLVDNNLALFSWGQWTMDDLLAAIAVMPIGGEFGEFYHYNNEVYASAGYLALIAAGYEPTRENYVSLMQERIFAPIGMKALITDDVTALGDNYATAYQVNAIKGLEDPEACPIGPTGFMAPAGGVWTSINDMARYIITQANGGVTPDGTRIVSAQNLAVTWEPGVDMGGSFYGMGWVLQNFEDVAIRWHAGGWGGYRAVMMLLPDSNTSVIIFCNSNLGDFFGNEMGFTFIEMLYGLEQTMIDEFHRDYEDSYGQLDEQFAGLPAPEVDPAVAAPFLGAYEGGWALEQRDDQTLWMVHQPGWEFMLNPLMEKNRYVVVNGDALGTPIRLVMNGDQAQMVLILAENELPLNKLAE